MPFTIRQQQWTRITSTTCVYLWYIFVIHKFHCVLFAGRPRARGTTRTAWYGGTSGGPDICFYHFFFLHRRRILSDWMLNFSFPLFCSLCDRAQQDEPACLDWKVIRWSKYLYYCSASVCNVWLGRTIWDPCDILLTHPANSVLCISV